MSEINTILGTRKKDNETMVSSFLKTGQIPLGLALNKGLISLFTDPWFTWLQYMSGPAGRQLRQLYYHKRLGYMGKGVVIDPDVDLPHPRNVYLDDFCYLGRKTQIYSPEGYVKIGKRCHIIGWILGHGGVEIGDYVGCGGYVFSATDSHQGGFRMAGPMIPPEQRNVKKAKVIIENDAFIGHHSIVMPGVKIGEGAIVGPYSMVYKDVEPWTVVSGNPARAMAKRDHVRFPYPD